MFFCIYSFSHNFTCKNCIVKYIVILNDFLIKELFRLYQVLIDPFGYWYHRRDSISELTNFYFYTSLYKNIDTVVFFFLKPACLMAGSIIWVLFKPYTLQKIKCFVMLTVEKILCFYPLQSTEPWTQDISHDLVTKISWNCSNKLDCIHKNNS